MKNASRVCYVFVRNEQDEINELDRYFPDPEDLTAFGRWVYNKRLPKILQGVMKRNTMSPHLACRYGLEWAIRVCTDDISFEDRCRHFEAMCYHDACTGRLYELLMNDSYGSEFCDQGQGFTQYGRYISTEAFPSIVRHISRNTIELSPPLVRMCALEWIAYMTTLNVVPSSTAMAYRIGVLLEFCLAA
jgi:hypothetical protein